MGAYKDKNGTWYAQFRFTNWKGEPDRKTKRGFATKREALDWERDFLTQSSGNLEMTFEAFYELYKKNMKERIKLSTWNMKESVIEGKILPYFKRKRMCDIKPRDVVEWQNTLIKTGNENGEPYSPVYLKPFTISSVQFSITQSSSTICRVTLQEKPATWAKKNPEKCFSGRRVNIRHFLKQSWTSRFPSMRLRCFIGAACAWVKCLP